MKGFRETAMGSLHLCTFIRSLLTMAQLNTFQLHRWCQSNTHSVETLNVGILNIDLSLAGISGAFLSCKAEQWQEATPSHQPRGQRVNNQLSTVD